MQRHIWICRACLFLALTCLSAVLNAATVSGQLFKWHPVELDFQGPWASETDSSPNPFLDYRLTVRLVSPSGRIVFIPGFFDGDGQGGGAGSLWRARFSADEVGDWQYQATLKRANGIAVSLDTSAGVTVALEGEAGSFWVSPAPADAPGFLRHGRLEYVGAHYLKFRDGPYWIKGGTDSPENLLGYSGIDGTFDQGGIIDNFLHDFAAHRMDWRDTDPLFSHQSTGADSRGLIGALNYLGAQGVNSVYFLPMNLGGDGQDTYPFVDAGNNHFDKTHYDISKLHQWNTVLNHAQRQGIALNIVLSETEQANEQWLDNGELGVERKLFFRELVARFSYLLAVKWNLGEENDFPRVELDKHADYLRAIDWSGKPIAVHTHINQFYRYGEIVGDPRYQATSIQYDAQFAGEFVEQWRNRSADTGHPWVIDMDENTNGLRNSTTDARRKEILYDVLFSGGNLEWYFGYNPLPVGGDVDAGDFRQREVMWKQMRYAREMMQAELPFWSMVPNDSLVRGESSAYGGAEVFTLPGEIYAVYLPASNGQEVLDLGNAAGQYQLRWFDPREGRMYPASSQISGMSEFALGYPPFMPGEDWVALVTRSDASTQQSVVTQPDAVPNDAPWFDFLPSPTVYRGEHIALTVTASDSDGTYPSVTVGQIPQGMQVRGVGNGQLELSWTVSEPAGSSATVELIAIDALDNTSRTNQVMTISVLGADGISTPPVETAPPVAIVPDRTTQPVLRAVPFIVVSAGQTVIQRIQADYLHPIPPSLVVMDAPPGSGFYDNGDGTRTFQWQTSLQDVGFREVTFIAYDNDDPTLMDSIEVEFLITD